MTTRDPQISDYLVRVLKHNGFSEHQALVYLACLKLGQASVWDIAETSGVKRTTCYVVLKDLMERNIASEAKDSKKALYSVVSPDDLWFNLKNRQKQLVEAMSELSSLGSGAYQKPVVRMFEGVDGVEKAYRLTLDMPEGSEILIYGTPEVYTQYQEMINKYVSARVAGKIRVRAIIADSPLGREVTRDDEAILRETRVLPKDVFEQKTEINILPDAILYIAHSEKKPFATMIENTTLAQEEKMRFELLWNLAKKIV